MLHAAQTEHRTSKPNIDWLTGERADQLCLVAYVPQVLIILTTMKWGHQYLSYHSSVKQFTVSSFELTWPLIVELRSKLPYPRIDS